MQRTVRRMFQSFHDAKVLQKYFNYFLLNTSHLSNQKNLFSDHDQNFVLQPNDIVKNNINSIN